MTFPILNANAGLSSRRCWQITRQTLRADPRCRQQQELQRYADELYDRMQVIRSDYLDQRRMYRVFPHEHHSILRDLMTGLLAGAYVKGYREMMDVLEEKTRPLTMIAMENEGRARADFSARTILHTTERVLRDAQKRGEDIDKLLHDPNLWIFSKARAHGAVDYEGARGYWVSSERGLRSSQQSGVWGKQWLIDPDIHQRTDDCDDNEAAGIIPLGALFPSGVAAPPDHTWCGCSMQFVRLR